jgi:hypothetical protein
MRYFWAFLFIALGVSILGSTLNWWGNEFWLNIWRLWPLILIFAGLELITRGYPWQPVVMLAAVLVSGLLAYDLIGNKNPVINWGSRTNTEVTESKISVDAGSAKEADVAIKTGAVQLTVDGTTDKLVDGSLTSNVSNADVHQEVKNDKASVEISTPGIKDLWLIGHYQNFLKLALSKALPINLSVDSGASSVTLNLKETNLSGLTIKSGASSLNVQLGDKVKDGTKVNVDAGAASIDMSVPTSYGVRIISKSGLSSQNFTGFTKVSDDTWESEGYGASTKKMEVTFKSGASSIKVNRN